MKIVCDTQSELDEAIAAHVETGSTLCGQGKNLPNGFFAIIETPDDAVKNALEAPTVELTSADLFATVVQGWMIAEMDKMLDRRVVLLTGKYKGCNAVIESIAVHESDGFHYLSTVMYNHDSDFEATQFRPRYQFREVVK